MHYIIYARKSTESEDRQSLSIQSQIIEMQEIARREGLSVIKIFQESKSAKAPGRPVFAEMMKFIQQGKAQGVLCWKIDRLARNPVDEGMVKWMLQNETIKQIRTFDREYNPEDNVVMASIEFSMATQYIRDLSKNVRRGLAEKVRRGEYPGPRPFGYMSDYKTKAMIQDPQAVPFVLRVFDLYISDNLSVESIANTLYEEGFRSRLGNRVGKSTVYRILTNPVYAGLFKWKGQVYNGVHEPIISLATFEEATKRLEPKKWQTQHTKRLFTYRGFLVCGECGLKVTAEIQKGHTYYRCTKSKGVRQCSQPYTREEDLEKHIAEELKKIHFDDEILDLIVDASKEKLRSEDNLAKETEARLLHILEDTRRRKESLVEKFIDNALPKEIYDRKYSEITMEEANIEEKLSNAKHTTAELGDEIEQAVRFIKTAHNLFNLGTKEMKRDIVEVFTSNIGVKDRKLAYFDLNDPFLWLREDVETLTERKRTFELNSLAIETKKEALASHRSTMLGC
ncbi:MAG: recombinase family protein [Candidatus Moranbacteria bacterium]|nr:recombinase family protein [Candidatus Moranbacteria bacterium]MDD3964903.1 recombinase family protein [Candidatus Moranbacteria bacterium]